MLLVHWKGMQGPSMLVVALPLQHKACLDHSCRHKSSWHSLRASSLSTLPSTQPHCTEPRLLFVPTHLQHPGQLLRVYAILSQLRSYDHISGRAHAVADGYHAHCCSGGSLHAARDSSTNTVGWLPCSV